MSTLLKPFPARALSLSVISDLRHDGVGYFVYSRRTVITLS